MEIPGDQLDEINALFEGVQVFEEAGQPYLLIPKLGLPPGCDPASEDVLLCPAPRDGYPSRLFFGTQIRSRTGLNWNGQNARIIERNWFAYSWKVDATGLRLAQVLACHLRAL